MEVANHSGHHLVIARIKVVEDSLGQLALHIEAVEILGHILRQREVANRIKACIHANGRHLARVVITNHAEVELLCPARLPIHNGKLNEHSALILAKLHIRELLATIHLRKDGLNLSRGVILGVELLYSVVA